MTNQSPVLIDTDVLSAIMRKHLLASERAREYLEQQGQFTFSVITRYEVLRGLLAKGAVRQLSAFDHLCSTSSVLPVNDAVIVRAAAIYADLHRRGELISDADILIAATALTRGFVLTTNNEAHFRRIQDLKIENWLAVLS
jgi:tRNA(fMet)-specific endonuclease VapC